MSKHSLIKKNEISTPPPSPDKLSAHPCKICATYLKIYNINETYFMPYLFCNLLLDTCNFIRCFWTTLLKHSILYYDCSGPN